MPFKTSTDPAKIPRRGHHCVIGLPAGRPQLPKGKGPVAYAQGHADLAVTIYPHTGVDVDATWDELLFPNYTLHEPNKTMPMGVFEARPVQGRRIMAVDIQIEGDSTLSLVFHGATWLFREAFDDAGVAALRDESSGLTYRVLKSMDVSDGMEPITRVLGHALRGLVVRATVQGRAQPGTAAHACIQVMRGLAQMHFV